MEIDTQHRDPFLFGRIFLCPRECCLDRRTGDSDGVGCIPKWPRLGDNG